MIRRLALMLCLPIFFPFPVQASSQSKSTLQYEEISLIKNAVENFIYSNTATLPGQVIVNIDKIDKHLSLPKCPQLEPFIPTGSRLWGKTSIGVRCNSQFASWTIYIQAEVNVMADVLHVARPVSTGQILAYEDIAPQNVNLTHMPDGIFTQASQIIGKVATTNLTAGQPLRAQMLRAPYVILRGQKVNLVVQGRGFSISSEGQALADAAEGKVIQVRNKSGRIISGIARINSIVEIQP
ncbi:flagella basal body P-ring formation protein FlgA [Nitrosomonas sp. Nm166]|nr:flagella basal body P-ring formation protein FlgA [Nitrosomonas sp. Nm166]